VARLNTCSVSVHAHGKGAPLLLLHCLGVDHHFWDFTADLAGDFRLLSYDLPGHGQAPVPGAPYSIEDLAEQTGDILRLQNIPKAHVAGISLAGLIAQRFAAAYPNMVDRLVLIDTTPRYTDELRSMWAVRAATARERGVANLIDGLLPIWFTPAAIAQDTAAVRYVREALARTSAEGYALACEALAAADLRADAAQISAPTLVMCGDDDIPSFLDAARWLGSHIAKAHLSWITNARHASVLEQPAPAMRWLREFLS
jgi:3-oxoadipate enol-lactonase